MRRGVALLLLLIGVVISQNILPGIDFVGFGFDARFADAQDALQIPILDYSYTTNKTYAYPTDPSNVFLVPDQIFVRTVAYTEANAYLFDSYQQVVTQLATDSGVTTQQTSQQNLSQITCVNTFSQANNKTTQNCTTTSNSTRQNMFSIGSEVNYLQQTFSRSEVFIIQNSEKTQLFNIYLDSSFIRHEVKVDLQALAETTFNANPQLYIRFLEKYGTHYVVSATMGGDVQLMTITDQSTGTSTATQTTTGTTGTGALSKQQALAGATSSFSSQLTGTVGYGLSLTTKNVSYSSQSNWKLFGGNSNLVNLLDSRNSSLAILVWKQSITENPVAVKYRLREVSTLFDDPTLRKQLEFAVDLYLTFDTSSIISVNNTIARVDIASQAIY